MWRLPSPSSQRSSSLSQRRCNRRALSTCRPSRSRNPGSLLRLAGQTMWLLGTLALLTGYVVQAAALDRGRLAIIQPLLVTTVVFALPLGYFLTRQHVGRREVIGATVIVLGLALFAYFGDIAGGNENAPNGEWAVAIGAIVLVSAALLVFGRRGGLSKTAAGVRHRGGDAVRPVGLVDQADAGLPARERRHDALALGAVRAGDRRRARVRAPAGLARHGPPRTVRRDRVRRESPRRHPHRASSSSTSASAGPPGTSSSQLWASGCPWSARSSSRSRAKAAGNRSRRARKRRRPRRAARGVDVEL